MKNRTKSQFVLNLFWSILIVSIFNFSTMCAQKTDYQTAGSINDLPVFYKNLVERQNYPLAWENNKLMDFGVWKAKAKAKVMESLMTPPPIAPFNAKVISEKDRGTYIAKKVVFNITADSRIVGLLLVPKAAGTHPAVLLLHDHGGKFDIGKEKVVEPWDETVEKVESAKQWVKDCYGGRYFGDELAKKGYVCFVTDMLDWCDRQGSPDLEGQQALASNMLHLGASFAGLIALEDMRAAEFLSQQPGVDASRIAAMGLSVGGFRTWQVAALSDYIAAGVSVCWMSTYHGLMVPKNNQTKGGAAYTMLHPGLSQYLDYPDVASLACPKPMFFIGGSKDHLFPTESIKDGYAKMQKVWDSQNAGNKLHTKIYDAPHEYNIEMQKDAFEWLDNVLKNK